MNFILDMAMLFVVLSVVLILNIPDLLSSSNLLTQQIFIYIIVTGYYIGQKYILTKFINKQPVDFKHIIKESISSAVPCMVGFIIFTDLAHSTGDSIGGTTGGSPGTQAFIQSFVGYVAPTGQGFAFNPNFKLAYVVAFFIVFFAMVAKMFSSIIDIETYK